jgi:hypothetical protein
MPRIQTPPALLSGFPGGLPTKALVCVRKTVLALLMVDEMDAADAAALHTAAGTHGGRPGIAGGALQVIACADASGAATGMKAHTAPTTAKPCRIVRPVDTPAKRL